MTGGSLFSGIEGIGLGLLWSGLIDKIVWQVEIDEYCNKVLERHFPNTKRFKDIRDCGKHNLEPVDVIFGGFPCQPFSVAGKRKGEKDDRYLWPEMVRIIEELKPIIVIGENVPGIIKMGLDEALSNLESLGYSTTAIGIPAIAVNAWHVRQRIWIIAYSDNKRIRWRTKSTGYDKPEYTTILDFNGLRQSRVRRMSNGIPHRMDRLRCVGNAVVPQVAQVIGEIIKDWLNIENEY